METRQLKNIAILLLLMLNACLLALLGYQAFQGRQAFHEAMESLGALFEAEGLTLTLTEDIRESALEPLALTRQADTERSIAAFLLGENVQAERQGGGIYSYQAAAGTVQFRAGGGFDTVGFQREVEDPAVFATQFCEKFGYQDVNATVENETLRVTAMRYVADVPVLGCGVTLEFHGTLLASAAGAHVELGDAETAPEEHLTCISALTKFLDYRRSAGIVCSEVQGLQCVYELQSAGAAPRLHPIWEVVTDSYTYLVDGMTGEVRRK